MKAQFGEISPPEIAPGRPRVELELIDAGEARGKHHPSFIGRSRARLSEATFKKM
jgi:hypothetical protein